jgi:hypothetical protein
MSAVVVWFDTARSTDDAGAGGAEGFSGMDRSTTTPLDRSQVDPHEHPQLDPQHAVADDTGRLAHGGSRTDSPVTLPSEKTLCACSVTYSI